MRLLGDPNKQAAVEIYDGFTWSSICATSWNLEAAGIVCRHFGYITALGALQIPVDAEEVHARCCKLPAKLAALHTSHSFNAIPRQLRNACAANIKLVLFVQKVRL